MRRWSDKTEIAKSQYAKWLGIARAKLFAWQKRYGRVNEHNSQVPRDHWIENWERLAIVRYFQEHPLDGYRRLAFMMLDEDVVAVSPSTVYRVLSAEKLLNRWNGKPSKKGVGFEQPTTVHEHWHVDIAYLNLAGTFYYLCSVLDGFSRAIVHWEIRECMKEADVETVLQRAREAFPRARPRIISDNGPQFVAKDFKEFIRVSGMTHVRTSAYYPQSNGKLERWHRTIKSDAIRASQPRSLDEARKVVRDFVEHYNNRRLHSAIGFVTPSDVLEGRQEAIWEARDAKLALARERRREARQAARDAQQRPAA